MRLALNMATMAKGGFSRTAIVEMQQLIKKPRTKGRQEKKRGVVFPGHDKVKAAIKRYLAMVRNNQTDGYLARHNDTAKIVQRRWRLTGKGASPPRRAPLRPGTPPAPSVDDESSESEDVPPGHVYIDTSLPSARFFNLDPYAKDRMRNQDFIPDLLTDEGPSSG